MNSWDKDFLQTASRLQFFSEGKEEEIHKAREILLETGQDIPMADWIVRSDFLSEAQANQILKLLQEGYLHCSTCSKVYSLSFPQNPGPCGHLLEKIHSSSQSERHTKALASALGDEEEKKETISTLFPKPSPGFQILTTLGSGGHGAVYQARDPHTHRTVALKILLPKNMQKPTVVKRFQREIKITANLEHPNIIPVYETGNLEDGSLYYIMKEIPGGTLKELFNSWREEPSRVPPISRRLEIFLKICDGIEYAHSKGVIHRDLKPSNIAIGDFGEVIVMDWGIAKSTGIEEPEGEGMPDLEGLSNEMENLTLPGTMLGTPGYMPPEQLEGKEATIQSDIFSLGTMLYELLTLHAPFPGKTRERAIATLKKTPEAPHINHPQAGVPEELSAIALKCLQRNPQDRYPSAKNLKEDIELFLQGHSVSVKKDNPLQKFWKWMKRNSAYGEVLAGILIVGILAFWINLSWDKGKKKKEVNYHLIEVDDLLHSKGIEKAVDLEKKFSSFEIGSPAEEALKIALRYNLEGEEILEKSMELTLNNKKLRDELKHRLSEVQGEIGHLCLLKEDDLLSQIYFGKSLMWGANEKAEKGLSRLKARIAEKDKGALRRGEAILEKVKSSLSPNLRQEWMDEIVKIKSSVMKNLLLSHLDDEEEARRIFAIEALGKRGERHLLGNSKGVGEILVEKLKKLSLPQNEKEIEGLIWALGRLKESQAKGVLEALKKKHPDGTFWKKVEMPLEWISLSGKK